MSRIEHISLVKIFFSLVPPCLGGCNSIHFLPQARDSSIINSNCSLYSASRRSPPDPALILLYLMQFFLFACIIADSVADATSLEGYGYNCGGLGVAFDSWSTFLWRLGRCIAWVWDLPWPIQQYQWYDHRCLHWLDAQLIGIRSGYCWWHGHLIYGQLRSSRFTASAVYYDEPWWAAIQLTHSLW